MYMRLIQDMVNYYSSMLNRNTWLLPCHSCVSTNMTIDDIVLYVAVCTYIACFKLKRDRVVQYHSILVHFLLKECIQTTNMHCC